MTGDVKADLKLHETCLAKFAADQEIVGLGWRGLQTTIRMS